MGGRLHGLAPSGSSSDGCPRLREIVLLKPRPLREVVSLFCGYLGEAGELHLLFTFETVGAIGHTGRFQHMLTLTNLTLQACLSLEFIDYICGLALESYGRRMGSYMVWNRFTWKVGL